MTIHTSKYYHIMPYQMAGEDLVCPCCQPNDAPEKLLGHWIDNLAHGAFHLRQAIQHINDFNAESPAEPIEWYFEERVVVFTGDTNFLDTLVEENIICTHESR